MTIAPDEKTTGSSVSTDMDVARAGPYTGGRPSLVIYLPDFSGGGAERLHVEMAPVLAARGIDVRFLVNRPTGPLAARVTDNRTPVDVLAASRQIGALPKLARYLLATRPDVILANTEHMNLLAIAAGRVPGVRTRAIVTQHNAFSEQIRRRTWQFRVLRPLSRLALPAADAIVAVSAGVAVDLAVETGIDRSRIEVVYNGLVGAAFEERRAAPPPAWTAGPGPLIVAMGRMVPQKDFATLLQGFAALRRARPARLVLLGDGPERPMLTALAEDLGVAADVVMPGFVDNPLPVVAIADLFALSSRFEGFGNVLVEALACGTPVVSTDCPFGPSEILDGGRYGRLVPIGRPDALAAAMSDALDQPRDRAALKRRAASFRVEECADRYAAIVQRLVRRSATPVEVNGPRPTAETASGV